MGPDTMGCNFSGETFSSVQTNAKVLHRASRNKATGHILGRLGRSRLFGMETILQAKTEASWEALAYRCRLKFVFSLLTTLCCIRFIRFVKDGIPTAQAMQSGISSANKTYQTSRAEILKNKTKKVHNFFQNEWAVIVGRLRLQVKRK